MHFCRKALTPITHSLHSHRVILSWQRVYDLFFRFLLIAIYAHVDTLSYQISLIFVMFGASIFSSIIYNPYRLKSTGRLYKGLLCVLLFHVFLGLVTAQQVKTPFTLPTRQTYLIKLTSIVTIVAVGCCFVYWIVKKR